MIRGLRLFVILLTVASAANLARPAVTELRIAVNTTTIESFPVFMAAKSLGDSNKDVRVRLQPAPNGRVAMAQLVQGEADAVTGSETQVLLNATAEPRLRIVLTLAECRYRIVARRSSGISRVSDLRGKKIAATPGTSSQYYLAGMLREAHLKDTDIQPVVMEGPDMAAALKSGAVDAVSIWEPHAQNALEALGNDAIVFQDPAVYTERFNLNTRSDVLADPAKRAAMVRFIQEIRSVSTRLRKGSPEIIRPLAPRVSLSEKMVLALWPQFQFPASISNKLLPSMIDVEAWAAETQKRKPHSSRELTTLIDTTLLGK